MESLWIYILFAAAVLYYRYNKLVTPLPSRFTSWLPRLLSYTGLSKKWILPALALVLVGGYIYSNPGLPARWYALGRSKLPADWLPYDPYQFIDTSSDWYIAGLTVALLLALIFISSYALQAIRGTWRKRPSIPKVGLPQTWRQVLPSALLLLGLAAIGTYVFFPLQWAKASASVKKGWDWLTGVTFEQFFDNVWDAILSIHTIPALFQILAVAVIAYILLRHKWLRWVAGAALALLLLSHATAVMGGISNPFGLSSRVTAQCPGGQPEVKLVTNTPLLLNPGGACFVVDTVVSSNRKVQYHDMGNSFFDRIPESWITDREIVGVRAVGTLPVEYAYILCPRTLKGPLTWDCAKRN